MGFKVSFAPQRITAHLIAAMAALGMAGSVQAQSGRCESTLDALTLRTGMAVRPLGAAASVETSLESLGRASYHGAPFSIWRIVNGDGVAHAVTVVAGIAEATKLTLPPRTETYLRSSSTGEHTLLVGARKLVRQSPRAALWRDPRPVADPLCDEPAFALWLARRQSLTRVSTIDGEPLVDIPLREDVGAIALDHDLGNIWRYSRGRLQAFDSRGASLVDVRTIPEPRLPGSTAHLEVDAASGELWLALGRHVHRIGFDGSLLGSADLAADVQALAFDPANAALRAGTRQGIVALRAASADQGVLVISRRSFSGGVHALAQDPLGGELWLASGDAIRRLDDTGRITFEARGRFAAGVRVLAADRSGGVWGAGSGHLAHFDDTGAVDWNAPLADLPGMGVTGLEVDPQTNIVWIASAGALLRYSRDGRQWPLLRRLPLSVDAPAVGLESLASRLVSRLTAFDDRMPPSIEIVSPEPEATLDDPRPPLRIRYADAAGTVDLDSIEVLVNGQRFEVSCRAESENVALCAFTADLPEGATELAVTLADDSGNRSAPVAQRFQIDGMPESHLAIEITSPALDRPIADRTVSIAGLVTVDTGPTLVKPHLEIDGVGTSLVAAGGGFAFVHRRLLEPGENVITLEAELPDGVRVSRRIVVIREGETPFGVTAPDVTMAAHSLVLFDVAQLGPVPYRSVALDLDDDGIADQTFMRDGSPVALRLESVGIHPITAQVTAVDGRRFDYFVPVVISSVDEIDEEIRNGWNSLLSALANRDVTRALDSLTTDAQDRYRPVFEQLRDIMPAIVGELSPLQRFEITGDSASYVVTRNVSGVRQAFVVSFVCDRDRHWRVGSL